MTKINLDKRNYRKHSEKNRALIEKSLKNYGAGRSILIDKENTIIAGNGVYEQAEKLNIPVKIIETNGSELIAVKRTDIEPDSDKRKELAVLDNKTSDTSEFDFELLQDDFDIDILKGFEFDDIELGLNDNNFIAGNGEKEVDENITTKNECPKCGYKF